MAIDTGDKVTRKYANFRGVDFRGEECSLNRSPDALNVWRDYKKLASIETRPGLERVLQANCDVSYIKKPNNVEAADLIFVSDNMLYRKYGDTIHENIDVGNNPILFEFGGDIYVKGSKYYGKYSSANGGTEAIRPENPYWETAGSGFIPTTTIKKSPSGGGETYQDVNMLSPFRINTFRGDGKSNVLYLDAQDIDTDFFPIITIGGTINYDGGYGTWICYRYPNDEHAGASGGALYGDGSKYASNMNITGHILNNDENVTQIIVDHQKGTIELRWAESVEDKFLPEPLTDGQDNISVVYKKKNDTAMAKIMKCTIAHEFDNRLFLSGNPDYPSTIWHSSLNDPFYFSDLDVYVDGADSAPIRGMASGNNALWVFRDAGTNKSVFYHVPTIDSDYGKVYPSSHSSIALGCVGRAINFGDDIVFFSERGMESASTDINTEQFATHRSSLVDRKMLTNANYKDMILAEWEGYLLVFIGNEVFLADSRAMLTNENHAEYEWYYWKLFRDDANERVTCATVADGVLYIGTNKNIYTVTGALKDGDVYQMCIDSYWTTPKDKFGAPNKLKTTNKKGCVIEAVGDVDVYAKVEDTDFELIGTNNDVEDYFVSRIKRKKFKDIQLKFQSQTGFCLESASLECFIGGYIKR